MNEDPILEYKVFKSDKFLFGVIVEIDDIFVDLVSFCSVHQDLHYDNHHNHKRETIDRDLQLYHLTFVNFWIPLTNVKEIDFLYVNLKRNIKKLQREDNEND